ncbi:hypothetical protein PPERSA_02632 [Pseudocohnilembus persalinus]|uniref:Uncharacterized protein n=1 Tax=Pseudocohnilembus persalinus TaxID=266149 RepID=A0A0V0R5X3_PSEPJ|nr:hypothetical protein PPERSA_02632 [Pseudocohnilembus persalinus]|eukprot:KRX09760.1 hypothetical protein PPERSA_02632 [Pseudocohnilembus persalinus]
MQKSQTQKQLRRYDRSLNTYDIEGSRPKQFKRYVNNENQLSNQHQQQESNNNDNSHQMENQENQENQQNFQTNINKNSHNYRHYRGVQDSLQLFQNQQEQQQNQHKNRYGNNYVKPTSLDKNELGKSKEINSLDHFKPVIFQNKYDDYNRFYNNVHRQNIQPKSQLKELGLMEFQGFPVKNNTDNQGQQLNRQIPPSQMQQVLQQNQYQLNVAYQKQNQLENQNVRSSRNLGQPSSMQNIFNHDQNNQDNQQKIPNRRHFQNQQDNVLESSVQQNNSQNQENVYQKQENKYQQNQQQENHQQPENQNNNYDQQRQENGFQENQFKKSQRVDNINSDLQQFEENKAKFYRGYTPNSESQKRYEQLKNNLNQKAQNIEKTFIQNENQQIPQNERYQEQQQAQQNLNYPSEKQGYKQQNKDNISQSVVFGQNYNDYQKQQQNRIRNLKGNNSSQFMNIFSSVDVEKKLENQRQELQQYQDQNQNNQPQILQGNDNNYQKQNQNYQQKLNDRYQDQVNALQQENQNQNQNNLVFLQQQSYLPSILQGNRRRPANENQTKAHQSQMKGVFNYDINQSSVF